MNPNQLEKAEEVRDMLSELCWLAQAYEAKEFGGDEMADAIDDRTKKIVALITKSNQELLDRIIAELPEKKEAKAPYDILELEKAFQNGRSKGLDEVLAVLESMR